MIAWLGSRRSVDEEDFVEEFFGWKQSGIQAESVISMFSSGVAGSRRFERSQRI